MFFNQFKTIIRQLAARKMYTIINVLGLGIGITAIVWAFQDYRHGTSFDNFHKDQTHIFRVITQNDGGDVKNGYCPLPVALFAKQDFASVTQSVRFENRYITIKGSQEEPFSDKITYTDPAFFDFFNFPLLYGSNDLTSLSGVVITESVAKKYFGNVNALGKNLMLFAGEPNQKLFQVNGVLKDVPINSSLNFGILLNFENYQLTDGSKLAANDWKYLADAVFLKLKNEQDASRLETDFNKYVALQNAARSELKISRFYFEPISKMADHEDDIQNNALFQRPGNSGIYGPLVLAILILLSSCLNFANTTVAQANQRLKEMGVRKVMGGNKLQLIIQQLAGCLLITFLAVLLSILFNMWWLPTFSSMFEGIKLEANYLHDFTLIKFLIGIILGVSILAGLYPALYISRFNASQIFRGGLNYGGNNLFSKLLLGLQITIAFITVTAGFGFARNAKFQQDFNFGFNQNNIVGVRLKPEEFTAFNEAVKNLNSVESTCGSVSQIGFSWRDKQLEVGDRKKEIEFLSVGDRYFDVMGLALTHGNGFQDQNDADVNKSIIVTEDICNLFNWKVDETVNKQIHIDTMSYTIIGTVKPLMRNFFNRSNPMVFTKTTDDAYTHLIVKAQSNKLGSVMDQLKASWTGLYPLRPFNAFYQNELATEAQRVNESIAKIFLWFSIISMLLTCTGMFALISLTILKKTREIAIRKVVGASLKDITIVIHKSYLIIFIIASCLGIFAGMSLTKLLMDLIFRINIGINMNTVMNTLITICVLVCTIAAIKIWQVDRMKPAAVLKAN